MSMPHDRRRYAGEARLSGARIASKIALPAGLAAYPPRSRKRVFSRSDRNNVASSLI